MRTKLPSQASQRLAIGYLGGPDVQAIVGFYGLVAASALQSLQARGIAFPGEIAAAGFDDEVAIATNPRLTTVRLPFYEIGRWSVDTLVTILECSAAWDVSSCS